MKKSFPLVVIILCLGSCGNGQVYFPFKTEDKKSSILAYWYNCKPDTAVFAGINHTSLFHSSLQIYGPFVADSFHVKAEVFLTDNNKAYENSFLVQEHVNNDEYSVIVKNDYFLLISPVPHLKYNPHKIKISISNMGEQIMEKWIYCKYHKLCGNMYDFRDNPLRAFIMIYPDGFDDACGVWSDLQGYYEIDLPERTYNAFYVNDGNYKSTTLEAWAWHMIMDMDQELDFKIGTGEVYNLNVWPCNGGFSTFFVSFRPMVLDMDHETSHIWKINEKEYDYINIAPDLEIKDLKITINGEQAEIYSLQQYFETSKDKAMPAYLVQLHRLNPTFGKQTIRVEYDKTVDKAGKKIFQNSMGYFQFHVNFLGYSDFN
jgi:hypothetical protein